MVKKKRTRGLREHKLLITIVIIVMLAILLAFGTKIALYINFIIGNDVIVKLDVDKENLILEHDQKEDIQFISSVTTNPFCKAVCNYEFIDISNNKVLEKDEFTIRPAVPFTKIYSIEAERIGQGLDLYRFDLSCESQKTTLCHTSEIPTSRSQLITVQYTPAEEETQEKQALINVIENKTDRLRFLKGKENQLNQLIQDLSLTYLEEDITEIKISFLKSTGAIEDAYEKLARYDFDLTENYKKIDSNIRITENLLLELEIKLQTTINNYNRFIHNLTTLKQDLIELRNNPYTVNTMTINNAIIEFNNVFFKLAEAKDLTFLEAHVASVKEKARKEVLEKQIESDIAYEALCEITGFCAVHSTALQRENQTEFSLNNACSYVEGLRNNYNSLILVVPSNYPDTPEFWDDIALKVQNIKQNITNDYLDQLGVNNSLEEFLSYGSLVSTTDYSAYNLTYALFAELRKSPELCILNNFTFTEINDISLVPIKLEEPIKAELNITIQDPIPQCCVFDDCSDCCTTDDCREDKYPIIFLHGHAINKETSAEYSLEGFNKIQDKLEEDGYLNAGSITLFTSTNTPVGILGMPNVPLTFRASYYFDIFKEPENYVVVQAKSESIDTYAIRLKELVETVKYKTGKSKVRLVAFSMGGLVSRQYLNLFGTEDVDKLILIGTPNKGISGDVEKYCPVIGEGLECRDMNENSLFLNKLNRAPLPKLSVFNIIGTGCDMQGEDGDGAVLTKSAMLDGARNFIIDGSCPGRLDLLHTDLRDIDQYPEVYEILKKALEE
ncbi:MAG: alpha/beta hydrolase [Candidatus Woesearchaeota archaeon]